ncbi:MAG: hypothetical protein CM1200mP29_00470 [Verrucomicrobiota bacterium]|nr:MAG: hypothetical protein CM1200mP29_00470 [Verrucomicrobiota bacterium]
MAAKKITGKFDSIDAVLRDIAHGKMAVVVDDADRENEGDLIMAAEKTTPRRSTSWPGSDAASSVYRPRRSGLCNSDRTHGAQ